MPGALLIPASAPLLTGQRAVVYVEQSPGYFEAREVTLGSRLGDHYEVMSGLEEGELIVSRGAFRIDSELQLRGRPSMMAPGGQGAAGHDHDAHGASGHGTSEHDHSGHSAHADGDNAAAEQSQGTSLSIESALDIDVSDVFARYHDLWYALHNDDLAAWQQAAPLFYDAVAGVQWPQHAAEIESHLNQGAGHAHHVNDIVRARDHFYAHSQAVIALAHSGYHEGTLYLMFCPMARDDAGAYWLQQEDSFLNPYFGSQMLRCGSMRGALEGAAGGHGE